MIAVAGGASSPGEVAGPPGRGRVVSAWCCYKALGWAVVACVMGSSAVGAAPAEAPASLDRYRCTICHADHETLAGPAFADVARKYAEDRQAVAKIARDIRRGVRTGAPWHMPPHPEVSPDVARTMARYIMSLSTGALGRDVPAP